MSIINIKQYISNNLPSGNQIPITILVTVLQAMVDDFYQEFPEGGLEFTQAMLDHLNSIQSGAQVNSTSEEISFINGLQAAIDSKISSSYVDVKIADLVDLSPASLDTLAKLAASINNDADFYTTMLAIIDQKADKTFVPTLQQVTDSGATTNNSIIVEDIIDQWVEANNTATGGWAGLSGNGDFGGESSNGTGCYYIADSQLLQMYGTFSTYLGRITPSANVTIYLPPASGTLALLSDLDGIVPGNLQKLITADYVITDADNNYTLLLDALLDINITIGNANILVDNFECSFINVSTNIVTFIPTMTGVGELLNNDGLSLFEYRSCVLTKVMATERFILSGNLINTY